MKNLKIYLVISICINILLSYIILKKEPNYTELDNFILDRITKEHSIKKEKILRDSLRYVEQIKIKLNKINKLNKSRKNERLLYELELAKLKSINSDSAYSYILDSIKKMCCTGSGR